MNSTLLSTHLLLVLLFVGLLGGGCDSGSTGGGGGIIAPNSSEVAFTAEPDSSQTKSFTISYTGLSNRPRPDAETIPSAYQIDVADETGSPGDGASSFDVTFNAPSTSGSYAAPVRFRAGGSAATIRLAGTVIGVQLVADFENGTGGFVPFGGPSIGAENGQLRIDGTDVGGSGVYPGIAKPFDAPTNFEDTPVVAARVKVTSSSDGPAVLRAALNGAGDNPDANATVPALVRDVPADGAYATYYFDFRGNFVQYDGAQVDPTQIGEIVFLINDNNPDTFTGTIYIDEITRRQNIPSDGS